MCLQTIEMNKTDAAKQHATQLRSFGRRRGRTLSPRQRWLIDERLPQLQVDLGKAPPEPLAQIFAPAKVAEVWLEIGFGGSEHLIWQADANRGVGLIGCEPFEDGIVKAVSEIEARKLDNVRLHADDARDVLRWLPDAGISRAFILFPDPWPKRRHRKRRIVNPALLADLARVMKPGACLRIGTDIGDYVRTIHMAFQSQSAFVWRCRTADDWRVRPADWPATRYEQKALREGRRCYYMTFERTGTAEAL